MVGAILPGFPLHLWGVKLTLLQHSKSLPASVVSIDSAAWNGRFGTGIDRPARVIRMPFWLPPARNARNPRDSLVSALLAYMTAAECGPARRAGVDDCVRRRATPPYH